MKVSKRICWIVFAVIVFFTLFIEMKALNNCYEAYAETVESVADIPGQEEVELVSLGTFRISHYCNCRRCCGKWAYGKTYSGTYPEEGRTIATDKKLIPMGTKVVIDGITYTAEDTGSGIYGNRIDVYCESHQDALNRGIKYREVFLVK